MDMAFIKQLVEIGWPAIVTLGYAWLAREYIRARDNEVTFLRAQVTMLQAEVESLRGKIARLDKNS
jgi:hypothetical protein